MGAVERRGTAIVTALALAAVACTPRAQPKTLPPQAVTQTKLDPPPPSEPPVAAPERPRNETIVIEAGDAATGEATSEALVAAARAERERRRTTPPPAIVLDNKNLASYAGGQLTVAAAPQAVPGAASEVDDIAKREQYWRERSLGARQRWRDAVDAIATHEQEAADFRMRFYAEDDPYVRDGTIKPAWDRALDLLAQAKRDAEAAETAVADTMEEGRRAGAWPGWLREGLELEPAPAPPPPAAADPAEPKVLEDRPRDPSPP